MHPAITEESSPVRTGGRFVGNHELAEIAEREAAEMRPGSQQKEEVTSALAGHIREAWERNKQAKRQIEEEMLECLRRRRSIYDSRALSLIREQGGSEVYMRVVEHKVNALVSWLTDILLPIGDNPWGLERTPIPEVPPWVEQLVAQRAYAKMQEAAGAIDEQGNPVPVDMETLVADLRAMVKSAIEEQADEAAERHEELISDQLEEGGWRVQMEDFIDDFSTFHAGIMRGPHKYRRRKLSWALTPGGIQPVVGMEVRKEIKRVSPFDYYPSPDAVDTNEGDQIEHERFSRRSLYEMIGADGYDGDAIRQVLAEHSTTGLAEWLWTSTERARLENHEYWWMRAETGLIDGLRYHGSVQGLVLLQWGMSPDDIPDPMAEYEVEAVLVGRYVIYAEFNSDPLLRRPYHKACFRTIPGSFWGEAPPITLSDIADQCNTVARAVADNVSMASGPMMEANYDRLAAGENPHDIYPWKVIQTESSKVGANDPAIRWYQANMHAQELMAVYEEFERRADDAIGVPRYTQGNARIGGAGNTLGGLSMLFDAAARGIKRSIKAIDNNVIRPVVELYYMDNMLYHKDQSIKGDAKVVPRGASALLAKEQTTMRRNEFLALTNNPADLDIMGPDGRAVVLRETARGMDLGVNVDEVVPPIKEFRERMAQRQQNQPPNPDMARARAQAEEGKARLAQASEESRQKLANDAAATEAKIASEERIAKYKADLDHRAKQREIAERTATEARRARAEERANADAAASSVDRIVKMVEALQADLKNAQKAAQQPAQPVRGADAKPMEIHVHIDGKTGEAKTKRIKFDHNGDRLAGATMTEQSE